LLIRFQGVSKIYDNGATALSEINLHIQKGEFVFLVGSSGSGKTTFMKLIIRSIFSTSGSIYVNNKNLNKLKMKEVSGLRSV